MSDKKEVFEVIGKIDSLDLEGFCDFLMKENGINYIHDNWNPDKKDSIGFYKLYDEIPFYHKSVNIYDESWAKYYFRDLKDTYDYFNSIGQKLSVVYVDVKKRFLVVHENSVTVLIPCRFCTFTLFKDYDKVSFSELLKLTESSGTSSALPVLKGDLSVCGVKKSIENKKREVEVKQEENRKLQEELEEEIERAKRELEAQYADRFALLERKKKEMEEMVEAMNAQLYVLESQIYSIRCYYGEVVDFHKLTDGCNAPVDAPVIVYQKVRYLDEELGKYMSIYGFDGDDSDLSTFEHIMQTREDIRDLFAPKDKSVSLIRVSKTGTAYCASDRFANMLSVYKKYHGKTIGILVRNGENVYIGWTDEEKISLSDGNMFLKPEGNTMSELNEDTDNVVSTAVSEKVSRFFLFSLLQGILDNMSILSIPEKVSVMKPSPYVIFSLAEGWIEDNRFGSFMDILEKYNGELKKDDAVLTLQGLVRDDYYDYGGRNRYSSYSNVRGRGEKNRTYDAHVSNCKVYPVNLVDRYDYYDVSFMTYPLHVEKVIDKEEISPAGAVCTFSHNEIYALPCIPTKKTRQMEFINHVYENNYGKMVSVKDENPDILWNVAVDYYGFDKDTFSMQHSYHGGTAEKDILCGVSYSHTENHYFVSVRKSDTNSRCNFEIFPHECMNLTFLNSVFLKYAIMNQNIGRLRVGGKVFDYATTIKYLNVALEFILKREDEEATLITEAGGELFHEWQVALSDFKLRYNYHSLTRARASKFVREMQK